MIDNDRRCKHNNRSENGFEDSDRRMYGNNLKVMLEENKPKSWLKSVSALSNGLGGSFFFGIDNNGIVRGLDDVQHVCESISVRIRDYMNPLPDVEMIPVAIDGECFAGKGKRRSLHALLLCRGRPKNRFCQNR